MSDLTRIDTYLTTSLQAVTFYRGTRKPHTVLDPTLSSVLRLTHQVVKELHNHRARLHPCVTGWTLDLLDTEPVKENGQ